MPSESFELFTYCNVVFVSVLIKYISISTKGKFYIAQPLTLRLKPKRKVTNESPTLIMPWIAWKYSWCCLLTDAGNHALPRCLLNLISKDVFFGRSLLNYKKSGEKLFIISRIHLVSDVAFRTEFLWFLLLIMTCTERKREGSRFRFPAGDYKSSYTTSSLRVA